MIKFTVLDLFKNRNFTLLFSGQVLNELGEAIFFITLSSLMYHLTGSSIGVAGVLVTMTIPLLFLSPVTGFIMDSFQRNRLVAVSCFVRGACCLLIPVTSSMEWVYLLAFIYSLMGRFVNPVISVVLPDLIPAKDLVRANTWMGISYSTMNMLGSGLAGVLLLTLNSSVTFWINSVFFLTFGFSVRYITLSNLSDSSKPATSRLSLRKFAKEMKEALRFFYQNRLILFVALFFSITSLTGASFNTLAVEYTNQYLESDSTGYGMLMALRSAGGLAGMLLLLFITPRKTPILYVLYSLAGIGGIFVILSIVHIYIIAGIMLFLLGFINSGFNVLNRSIQQQYVPTELRGKIIGQSIALSQGVYMLSAALAGTVAVYIGIPAVFFMAGLLLMLFVLLFTIFSGKPQDRNINCQMD